jgi:hypothetical protein
MSGPKDGGPGLDGLMEHLEEIFESLRKECYAKFVPFAYKDEAEQKFEVIFSRLREVEDK